MKTKKVFNLNFENRASIRNLVKIEHFNLPNECSKFVVTDVMGGVVETYTNQNGEYHREDGPARIVYYKGGQIKEEAYFLNGEYHRIGAPAMIKYRKDGTICEQSYEQHNMLHREDGPAYQTFFADGQLYNQVYYLNNIRYSFKNEFEFLVFAASLKEEKV